MNPSRRLGEFLVERKVLSREVLEVCLQREVSEGKPLAAILVASGLVGEKDLVAAIADAAGRRFVDLTEHVVPSELDRLIPAELAVHHDVVAVDTMGDELVVAMADAGDRDAVTVIEAATGWKVQPAVAVRSELKRLLAAMYGSAATAPPPVVEIDIDLPTPERTPSTWGIDPDALDELHINDLLDRVLDLGGSDLHLTVGIHPAVRVNGELKKLTEFPEMNGSEIRRMVYAILTQKQREKFEADHELDTSHSIPGRGRFRVNVFLQRDSVGAVLRSIPYEIVPLESLGLPPAVAQFAQLPRGLVLVTGPTGSGKSTTLASLVDIINSTKPCHIMTVEDPIEFLHTHKTAVVNQREVGEDTHSFAQALKHVLRQDPDVILVGEMRDLETIHTAITAAETGHLVFGTLHTQDAPQSVDRIIDVFPAHQQQQVRIQLASALQGVVTQQLVPTADGKGRACASEVLVATPAIRNLIREGKTHQIYSSMQAGGKYGMQTMDQSLANHVKAGTITMATATERCANAEDLRRLAAEPLMAATFQYKVRDTQGRLLQGSLDGDSQALVANKLRQMGYVPIAIHEEKAKSLSKDLTIPGLTDRVKMKDVAVFSRQFATMINSGLSLIRALHILAEQTENKKLAATVTEVRLDVEKGASLSQSIARHPRVFNRLYIAMVRAGETGGVLDSVLLQLADIIEKQVELRRKITSAMTYPVAVLFLVLLIVSAMLIFVVPTFETLYADLGGTLPLPTRVLLAVSGFFTKFMIPLVVLEVAGAVAFKKWIQSDHGRSIWDALKLKVPIFGKLVHKTALTRFARTFAVLLRSGVPILEALEITSETVNNTVVARAIKQTQDAVKRGESVAAPLAAHAVFPPMVVQMLAVGEETGNVDTMLEKVSDFYDQEIEATVDALTSLLEPLLIVVMGGAVGGMVVALYMPMFQIINLVQ